MRKERVYVMACGYGRAVDWFHQWNFTRGLSPTSLVYITRSEQFFGLRDAAVYVLSCAASLRNFPELMHRGRACGVTFHHVIEDRHDPDKNNPLQDHELFGGPPLQP